MQQKRNNLINAVSILAGCHINSRFIFRLCHDLFPQVGILSSADVAVVIKDGLRLIHQGLQLILETEGFFQIHVTISSFSFGCSFCTYRTVSLRICH